MRLPRHLALCLCLVLPCAAHADDVTPAQAATMQQQLKDWLTSLLGPLITPQDLDLKVTGEGDHYRLALLIPGTADITLTATAKPLDGGRWAIEGPNLPDKANFRLNLPESPDKSSGGPTDVAMTVGKQDLRALIDPAMATRSTIQFDARDLALATDSPAEHQEQKIARYTVGTALQPAADGRVSLDLTATMEGWQSAATVNGDTAVAFGAEKLSATGKIDGVSRERAATLVAAISALIGALPPDMLHKDDKTDLPEAARAQLRTVIEGLADIMSAVRLEELIEGLQVEVAGMGGLAIQRLAMGFGGEAPDGRLHIWFDIGLDGLDTPSLPPSMTAFLPKHLALRPSLSGIQTADMRKLALDAAAGDAGEKLIDADLAAIFAHGGIDVGLETFAFDLGPAKVEGIGHVVVLSPKTWRGEARVTATGIDELAAQARTAPELQQALPFLILARGLARPDGQKLVWDIASQGGSVTINGLDLSKIGGEKPKGKPPGQPPKR